MGDQSMMDYVRDRLALRTEQHRESYGNRADQMDSAVLDDLEDILLELERRAEPTLDELLARARERWMRPVKATVGPCLNGQFLAEVHDLETWEREGPTLLAAEFGDTAIGALRAAVEGR